MEDNLYSKLVDDLTSNRINLTIIQIAIKESIRRSKDIPECVKNLVAPHGDVETGVIDICFKLIKQTVAKTELAYRRGMVVGEVEHSGEVKVK